MIQTQDVVVASDSLIVADLEDEAVLLDEEDGVYYGLNEVGTFIFGEIDDPRPVEDLVDRLASAYNVDGSQARADVLAFLNKMHEQGLLRVVAESNSG